MLCSIILPLNNAVIAQLVERSHGKAEVSSSILDDGSDKITLKGDF